MAQATFTKNARYITEAAFLYMMLGVLKVMPIKTGRDFAGFLTEKFGPLSKTNFILRKNLRSAFTDKPQTELLKIERRAWRNLGKVSAEFANLSAMDSAKFKTNIEFNGLEIIENAKKEHGNFIMVSGHMGNWEVAARVCSEVDPDIMFIYRKANNPFVESIIQRKRNSYLKNTVKKGSNEGIKNIIKHLKSGGSLAMLVDQKFTGGAQVEFFGKKVSAPDTHVELAQKLGIPLIAGRAVRKKNGKFLVEIERIETDGLTKNECVQNIYHLFEKWIKEVPEQWFWMHNRWGIKRK